MCNCNRDWQEDQAATSPNTNISSISDPGNWCYENGNKHVVVIQDLFTKWPYIFLVPDQMSTRIARLLAEEVIPCFGVLESDRGTNLLSNLTIDLCKMLGVKNWTPQPIIHSVMELWSSLTAHWRLLWGSMQPDSVVSGTISCLAYYGLIKTRHIQAQGRNPLFFCMGWTAGRPQRQHSCLSRNRCQQVSGEIDAFTFLC